jgi:hypothetical protein
MLLPSEENEDMLIIPPAYWQNTWKDIAFGTDYIIRTW